MNDILKKILRGLTQLIELLTEVKLRLPPVTRDNCGSNFVCNSDSFISSLEVDDIVFTDKDGDKYTTTQQFDHSLIINQLSKGDVARLSDDIEKALGDESSGFEAQAIEMNKKYGYARKAKDQLKHKNEKLCNRIDSLEQRIKGYEADLDGSTRLITAFRKAFTTVSGIVDGVMPNGGLGDDDDDAPF